MPDTAEQEFAVLGPKIFPDVLWYLHYGNNDYDGLLNWKLGSSHQRRADVLYAIHFTLAPDQLPPDIDAISRSHRLWLAAQQAQHLRHSRIHEELAAAEIVFSGDGCGQACADVLIVHDVSPGVSEADVAAESLRRLTEIVADLALLEQMLLQEASGLIPHEQAVAAQLDSALAEAGIDDFVPFGQKERDRLLDDDVARARQALLDQEY